MWEKIRVVFTIPGLRFKILLTLMFLAMFLAIYRIGWQIPLPIVDPNKSLFSEASGEAIVLPGNAPVVKNKMKSKTT